MKAEFATINEDTELLENARQYAAERKEENIKDSIRKKKECKKINASIVKKITTMFNKNYAESRVDITLLDPYNNFDRSDMEDGTITPKQLYKILRMSTNSYEKYGVALFAQILCGGEEHPRIIVKENIEDHPKCFLQQIIPTYTNTSFANNLNFIVSNILLEDFNNDENCKIRAFDIERYRLMDKSFGKKGASPSHIFNAYTDIPFDTFYHLLKKIRFDKFHVNTDVFMGFDNFGQDYEIRNILYYSHALSVILNDSLLNVCKTSFTSNDNFVSMVWEDFDIHQQIANISSDMKYSENIAIDKEEFHKELAINEFYHVQLRCLMRRGELSSNKENPTKSDKPISVEFFYHDSLVDLNISNGVKTIEYKNMGENVLHYLKNTICSHGRRKTIKY